MISQYVAIYDTNSNGKHLVLEAPTIDEAEQAFDELRLMIPKYTNAKIDWQYTCFSDEIAVGEIQ